MVIAYIRNLPMDSPTVAHMRGGDQFRGWDAHMYMLANAVDAMQDNTYAFITAHAKRKPQAPPRIERPASKQAKTNAGKQEFAARAAMAYQMAHKKKKGR